jgi:PIN domain nuclease of toxin-antitoxin system
MEGELFLLDTHTVVWALAWPERLSHAARAAIETGLIAVSVASYWEMINKKGRATAPIAEPASWWRQYVIRREIPMFPVRSSTSRDWRPWNGPPPTHMTAFCARKLWWKERR